MTNVTLIADRRVVAVPIAECGEPLVDLRESGHRGALRLDSRKRDEAGLWLHIRAGVAARLHVAQAAAPPGVNLLVVEGFRPLVLQRFYFERYLAELRAEHPHWDAERLRDYASRYVAPPDIVPPHSTGGAVDVTLIDDADVELDLGTRVNASPEESAGACFTAADGLSREAAANRAVLCRMMDRAGFVNYGTEWWHWSYGDRYWAFMSGEPAAVYGVVDRTQCGGDPGCSRSRASPGAVDPARER